MHNKMRVFLSGGISNLSIEDHNAWRMRFQEFLNEADLYNIIAFNPVNHIEELNPYKMNNKQAMDYDLHMLRNSDLVIVNFNYPKSIGTACELAIAYEKRIPILGLNEKGEDIHPWLENYCDKVFDTWESMITYFIEHYVNEWF